MADNLERLDEEDEGGPVKSFLDHLEDLRWVLIKSAVTLAVAMFVCLVAAPYVMAIIKCPLTQTRVPYGKDKQGVTVRLENSKLGVFELTAEEQKLRPI